MLNRRELICGQAGDTRVFDQARPRVHVGELFKLLGDRQKRGCRIIWVQRLPTAYLLPIVARTEIRHFR